MASITLTVPDAIVPRIIEAFEPEQKPDAMTDKDYIKQRIIELVKAKVQAHERQKAANNITVTDVPLS